MEHNSDTTSAYSTESEDVDAIAVPAEAPAAAQFDVRWVLITAVLAVLIAGTIIWLALQTLPSRDTQDGDAAGGTVPYSLFHRLAASAEHTMANWGWTSAPAKAPSKNTPLTYTAGHDDGPQGADKRTLTLDSGETLAGILQNVGITAAEAQKAIDAMRPVFNPRSLRAGQNFDVVLSPLPDNDNDSTDDTSRLTSFTFSPSIEHEITVTRTAEGGYVATDITKQLVQRLHHAGTKIDSSLYMSALHAGIPAEVVVQMIHMFSYKVDFQRDIHPGDTFEVLYDYYYTPAGQPARVGNITYARMILGGKTISLYRYQPDPDSPAGYYDAEGRSAKGILMKTPVDGARITSGFGMRKHPILGYSRMHKGVDFGVPIGTPVMAAGNGVVEFAGWAHGYGRFLLLKHANGLETAYGHLSRFARGIHRGSHVHQAETVAYSGMTGMATGPHLHYEVRVHGKQVNPQTFKTGTGVMLAGKTRRGFFAEKRKIDSELAHTHLVTQVAGVKDAAHTE